MIKKYLKFFVLFILFLISIEVVNICLDGISSPSNEGLIGGIIGLFILGSIWFFIIKNKLKNIEL